MLHHSTMKMVLAGDSGVGKTELLAAMCDKQCCSPRDTERTLGMYETTIGVDFLTTSRLLSDLDTSFMSQIWDTAGQERFGEIVGAYFRGADALLLVYDVTAPPTFASLRSRWMPLIERTRNKQMSFFIVGTKTDALRESSSRVPFESAQELAVELGGEAIETNSKQKGGHLAYAIVERILRRIVADRPALLENTRAAEAEARLRTVDEEVVRIVSSATVRGKTKKKRRCLLA
jgi:small GTP-binding protein